MVTFLGLPGELRDHVLSLVISMPSKAPAGYATEQDRVDLMDPDEFTMSVVSYRPRMNRTDWIPTLLVNHQLCKETLALIDIHPLKYTYLLDIMVVNGICLYPTWMSVPTLTNIVDKVHTSIRIDPTAAKEYHGFTLGCGGPPTLTWSFHNILERFVNVGPVVNPEKSSGAFAIKVLDIDIITPDVPESAFISAEKWKDVIRPRSRKEHLAKSEITDSEYMVSPATLAEFLQYYMDFLIGRWDSKYDFKHCWFLFERIGIMRLTIDGESYCEWDMAELLRDARYKYDFRQSPAGKGPSAYKTWKTGVYKARNQFGLPVLPDDDVEAEKA